MTMSAPSRITGKYGPPELEGRRVVDLDADRRRRLVRPAPEHDAEIDHVAGHIEEDRVAEHAHELEEQVDVGRTVGRGVVPARHQPGHGTEQDPPGDDDVEDRQHGRVGPKTGTDSFGRDHVGLTGGEVGQSLSSWGPRILRHCSKVPRDGRCADRGERGGDHVRQKGEARVGRMRLAQRHRHAEQDVGDAEGDL